MQKAFLINLDSNAKPIMVKLATSYSSKFMGLMGVKNLSFEEGLLLDAGEDSFLASSIHMFFMKFSIAVIWINSAMVVVDKAVALPWRPGYFPKRKARYTAEMHLDQIQNFNVGNRVMINEIF